MEMSSARLVAAMLAIAAANIALTNGCLVATKAAHNASDDSSGRGFLAEAVVENWWKVSALAARRTIAQHGVPDEVRPEYLVWRAKGPFRRVVVRNVTPPYVSGEDLGVVEQTIRYTLQPPQVAALKKFDKGLGYERDSRELAARSDREELNFLRLNLADDIIRRRMTPEEAERFRARALALENTGKTSPYMQGLRFTPEQD